MECSASDPGAWGGRSAPLSGPLLANVFPSPGSALRHVSHTLWWDPPTAQSEAAPVPGSVTVTNNYQAPVTLLVAGDGGAGQRRQEAVTKLRQQMDPAARQHTETRTMPGMGVPSDDE